MKLPPKDPAELKTVRFKFASELATAETIASVESLAVALTAGTDPSPALILSGAASIDAATKEVRQNVTGGLVGCDYELRCLVVGSTGLKHLVVGTLPVRTET